jgi:FKBP-type peptidyl-prolyl cis-trans isomerase (trigger factor)
MSTIQKQEDGTIKITVTIPWKRVEDLKKKAIDGYVDSAQIAGFRKGKAPKNLVEKQIDPEKLKEEVLRKLLPETYVESLKEHNLNPVISPKIHVHKVEEEKDWEYVAETCEAPEVKLENYKENIKKITAKSKIIIPGKEQQSPSFEDIAKELLSSTSVKIPKIILDSEVEKLLSQTLDEIKKLGLSLDQYLASTQRTAEDLRNEYGKKAENDVKLELALQKVAETEKITVEEKEIDEAITQAKSDAEKQNLQANRYLLASILRQQKTLDFLRSL